MSPHITILCIAMFQCSPGVVDGFSVWRVPITMQRIAMFQCSLGVPGGVNVL